jgi:hypothetical protein
MTKDDEFKVVDNYADLISKYNESVIIYENSKIDQEYAANSDNLKLTTYYFRK